MQSYNTPTHASKEMSTPLWDQPLKLHKTESKQPCDGANFESNEKITNDLTESRIDNFSVNDKDKNSDYQFSGIFSEKKQNTEKDVSPVEAMDSKPKEVCIFSLLPKAQSPEQYISLAPKVGVEKKTPFNGRE